MYWVYLISVIALMAIEMTSGTFDWLPVVSLILMFILYELIDIHKLLKERE